MDSARHVIKRVLILLLPLLVLLIHFLLLPLLLFLLVLVFVLLLLPHLNPRLMDSARHVIKLSKTLGS
jgi:hypothetical protein